MGNSPFQKNPRRFARGGGGWSGLELTDTLARNEKVIRRFYNIWVTKHKIQRCITADALQPWTNYVNNANEYLIIGAVVHSEYPNIRYLHQIIDNVQKFVWSQD